MAHQNSSIEVNAIEPQSGTTLTIGNSGQDVVVNADSIKNNVLKDAGGNALFTSNGSGTLSGVNAGFGGPDALVSTESPSNVANVTFTLGAYKEYHFEFFEIKPVATGETALTFQCSTDGSTFGPANSLTTTCIRVFHNEADNNTLLDYNAGRDLQSSADFLRFDGGIGVGTQIGCAAGYLHLFNPSSTTHYKNFTMTSTARQSTSAFYTFELRNTGYWAVTAALTHMRFKMQTGNISSGTIKMYGIK